MARVKFTHFAAMQYVTLAPHEQGAVVEKLFLLAEFPNAGPRVYDQWEGCRSIHAGHYRIIYFQPAADEVEIIYIQPARNAR